ncbi:MAG: NAD+ synthase [Ignavibacterium sp.]|nr:NAD+ synthase [Ignavibacterium sp.]MDW8375925.1 NAD+ synthase [Ignavibacteriales bacterium]
MKIFLCQLNPIIGALEYNYQKILDGYKKGIENGADLVIFPELFLLGYPPQDLVEKREFREAVKKYTYKLAQQTNSVGLLFGAITEDDDNIGTDIHNSALLCYEGKIQFIQHKTLIPNYDVFDEMRYFDPAKDVKVFEFKGEKLGISICEDIWNDADYWYKRRYTKDPVNDLIKQGATILINISASPYSYGKRTNRKDMLSSLCRNDNLPLIYCCCVAGQTELIFDGGSMCFDKKGKLVKLGKSYQEDFILFDTNSNYEEIINCESFFEEEVLNALVFGLREYCQKEGFNKVVLGLSGGIDSALVTCISVEALGSENVKVLLLPSKYSSNGSIEDSKKLCENLGVEYKIISIQEVVDCSLYNFEKSGLEYNSITEENIQARIRGNMLMAFSNSYGNLLLSTGNKSELAVGYTTLYGDMCGGLSVIGDVYKTDVYRLASYINREKEIIPKEIINKPPSAELKPNQKDQDTLPPYDILDRILRMYLEENKEEIEISELIGNAELVRKVLRMVDQNEFKRKQAPPVLRVSQKAFGYGRRYPIVQSWRS